MSYVDHTEIHPQAKNKGKDKKIVDILKKESKNTINIFRRSFMNRLFTLCLLIVAFFINGSHANEEKHYGATKIIATIGPASDSEEKIRELIKAGVNVFRFNMSHNTRDYHKATIQKVKKVSAALGIPVAVLVDLQGPRIRIGKFKQGSIMLNKGDTIQFDLMNKEGEANRVYFPHPEVFNQLREGIRIFLDDGKVRLVVVSTNSKDAATLKVIEGGKLSNNKGVNIPDIVLPISAITEKDSGDLISVIQEKPDWVALSFVQSAKDMLDLKALIKSHGSDARTIVKVETIPAVQPKALREIVKATDAVMVARGDLSVEALPENIVGLQDRIMEATHKQRKPLIVATQMMESMVNSPRPTNAEVVDVTYAVRNFADCVMLSGESAVGKYPVHAVTSMQTIANNAEDILLREKNFFARKLTYDDKICCSSESLFDAISNFANTGSINDIIVVRNKKGTSAKDYANFIEKLSLAKPLANIVSVIGEDEQIRFDYLSLFRGVYPLKKKATQQQKSSKATCGNNATSVIFEGVASKEVGRLYTSDYVLLFCRKDS